MTPDHRSLEEVREAGVPADGQERRASPGSLPPPDGAASAPPPVPASRRLLSALGLLALSASALFGGNAFGVRERFLGSETPERRAPAVNRSGGFTATTVRAQPTVLRSQPWWQPLRTLEGEGTMAPPPLTVEGTALQWRAKWSCSVGRLAVSVPGRARPLIDAACPGSGTAYATKTGSVALQTKADGPWRLEVAQQVDVPLVEPPLPSMSAPGTRKVAAGDFYRMDQTGNGSVTVYQLADGTYALRLDDFYTSPNVDLEIRFSSLEAPRTSEEYMKAPVSEKVAPLDITAGSMNFLVPPGIDPTKYRSLVIWCPLIDSAYAGATLRDLR